MEMARVNGKNQVVFYENSIKKSNELSMAKLNQGLSLNQMQLLAFSIYCTQQDGVTEFHKADFEKKFNMAKYKTEDAKKDSQRILSLQVGMEDLENDVFEYWNVFRKMKYAKGLFRFTWAEEMIPHILELKERYYVTTDLTIASKFKSSFTWTLYDFIKAHYNYWYKTISKDDLMKLFGVEKKKAYISNTGDFRKAVLDVAIKEINDYTELVVSYDTEKEGRSISGFKLKWSEGTKMTGATKKQIKEIKGIVDIVFEDMFEYMNLDNETDRLKARDLIREIDSMREFTEEPISITSKKANSLIQKAIGNFKALNRLLEKNHKPMPPESKKKVEFYNWLEERD